MRSAIVLRPLFFVALFACCCTTSPVLAQYDGDSFSSPNCVWGWNSVTYIDTRVRGDVLNPVDPVEDFGDEFDPEGQPDEGENLLSYRPDDEFTGVWINYYSPVRRHPTDTIVTDGEEIPVLVLRKMIAETPKSDLHELYGAYLAMHESRWSDAMKYLRSANVDAHPGFAMEAERLLAHHRRYRERMQLIDLVEAPDEGNRRRRRREVEDEYLDSLSGMLPVKDYKEFELHRFPRRTLTVSVAPGWLGDRDAKLRANDLKKLVLRAMAALNQAMRNRVALRFTADRKHADVDVKWEPGSPVASPDPESSAGGRVLGLTHYQNPSKFGFIEHADITIFLRDEFSFDDCDYATVLHELLHAVGIGRHCHDRYDVMYAWRAWNIGGELSAHNKRVLRLLYSDRTPKKLPIGNRAKSA